MLFLIESFGTPHMMFLNIWGHITHKETKARWNEVRFKVEYGESMEIYLSALFYTKSEFLVFW